MEFNQDFRDMLVALNDADVAVTFPVIARSDLITNKRATGRPKDLADIAGLEVSDDG